MNFYFIGKLDSYSHKSWSLQKCYDNGNECSAKFPGPFDFFEVINPGNNRFFSVIYYCLFLVIFPFKNF